MNLVLISRGTRATRHWAVNGPVLTLLGLAVACLLAAIFSLGMITAAGRAYLPGSDPRIAGLAGELQAQQDAVAAAREAANARLNALAARVGQLDAGIIRLNALGSRLTRMARLEGGEFDFSVPPAMGGPEESAGEQAHIDTLNTDFDALDRSLRREDSELSALAGLMVNARLDADVMPRGRPVESGFISSRFGQRTDPFTGRTMTHRGLDFAARSGTRILAVATGIVTWSGPREGYGRMVEVLHGNGYLTRYAHNASNLVAVGDHVEQGQPIALLGATGRATGPNLHFEVWFRGRPVDPAHFIRQQS